MRDAYVNRQKDNTSHKKPIAFGAHRYGTWGYIWHTEIDVTEWIKDANSKIPNSDSWWQGPVALYGE